MIKSMTGFGTAKFSNEQLEVTVEVKSLNSKSLDVNFRLPKNFSDKEPELRNILNQVLERGKVNVNIDLQNIGEIKPRVTVNAPLVKAYYQDLSKVATELGTSLQDIFRLVLQMPDVYQYESNTEELSENWEVIKKAVQEAVE